MLENSRLGENDAPWPWAQGFFPLLGINLGKEREIRAGIGSKRAGRGVPLPAAALPAAGSQVTAAPCAAPCARRPVK